VEYFSKKSAARIAAALMNKREGSPMIDVRKYWTQCRLHDWHYMMSDDPEVYRMGKDSEDYLVSLAHNDPAMAEVYKQWQDHARNCGPRPAEPKLEG
jgi:hypothetical protein